MSKKKSSFLSRLGKNITENPLLYILVLPGVIYYLIFNYVPMYGISIAFKDFTMGKGIFNSEWIGLQHFRVLFGSSQFSSIFMNSIILSLYRLFWGFPTPIFLSIILSECMNLKVRKISQTIIYLPHFLSWVVVCGIVTIFLSPTAEGPINYVITSLGGKPINFMMHAKYFRTIVVISEIWKEAGWGTIVYLAAISTIDPTYYEAAIIDGANRMRQIWHITLPSIRSTMVVLLILRMGSIMGNSFEQVFLLQNALTYSVSDIIETFTYRVGLREGRHGFAAAVGLFQSVIGMMMIVLTNTIAKKVQGSGLW